MITRRNIVIFFIFIICTGFHLFFSCTPIQLLDDLEGLSTPWVYSNPTNNPETPEPTGEPTPEPTDEPTPESTDEPTPEPTEEPTPTLTPIPVNAFSIIEAENYYECSTGIQIGIFCTPVTYIWEIYDGGWAMFASINFADGAAGFEVEYASGNDGGTIEIRLDDIAGPLIGTCSLAGTGDSCNFQVETCSISGASGIHDLYLVFSGGSTRLFSIDWIRFLDTTPTSTPTPDPTPTPTQIPEDAFSIIQGESYDDCNPGVLIEYYCVVHIGEIDNGEWALYGSLDFAAGALGFEAFVNSSTEGGTIELRLDDVAGTLIGTCPVPDTGGWCEYQMEACSVSGVSGIHDLYLVFTGDGTDLFEIDWFRFLSTAPTSTPAPTPTPTPYWIYDDSLVNDWDDWSWDSINNMYCTYPVYDGVNSLSVTFYEGYAALYFHNTSGDIQLNDFTYLSFSIHGGTIGGQNLRMIFRNSSNLDVGQVLYLNDYVPGGSVSPNTWEEVQVPLVDFNVPGGLIRKLIFQSDEESVLPVFNMDVIGFY